MPRCTSAILKCGERPWRPWKPGDAQPPRHTIYLIASVSQRHCGEPQGALGLEPQLHHRVDLRPLVAELMLDQQRRDALKRSPPPMARDVLAENGRVRVQGNP